MVMGEVTRGSCQPASPSLQEGALKAGWLKKQRSIMKNWQLRWFVLRSEQLDFYKDEDETKPQVIAKPDALQRIFRQNLCIHFTGSFHFRNLVTLYSLSPNSPFFPPFCWS